MNKFIKKIIQNIPALSTILIAIRDHRNGTIPSNETTFGFKLAGPHGMAEGDFETFETPIIRKLISRNDIFVNIGANVGYYCCFSAQAEKHTIAFEPHQVNVRLLLRNLEINNFSKYAEIYPTAVGAKNGILNLYGSGTAASLIDGWAGISSGNYNLVPVVTLDDVIGERFKDQSIFILIDVEGAELSVLQGALNTLRHIKKPWLLIEICITENQPNGCKINPNLLATFDLLDQEGYEVWTLEKNSRRIMRDEIIKIEKNSINTILIHNFLCIDSMSRSAALETIEK